MGCINPRPGKSIPALCEECDLLMKENLTLLTILEYLLIGREQKSVAISILAIRNRTEIYYQSVFRYRNFWISKTKKTEGAEIGFIDKCEKQIELERNQLSNTKVILEQHATNMSRDWNKRFKTLDEWKSYLEKHPSIAQLSIQLHEHYSSLSKIEVKSIVTQDAEIEEKDIKLIKSIKAATINLYKNPKVRVYYTEEIVLKEQVVEKMMKISNEHKKKTDKVNNIDIEEYEPNEFKKNIEAEIKEEKLKDHMPNPEKSKPDAEAENSSNLLVSNSKLASYLSDSLIDQARRKDAIETLAITNEEESEKIDEEHQKLIARLSISQK